MILEKDIILDEIEKNGEKIRSFGVEKLTLFGSFAHENSNQDSDIDFLVEFKEGRGLFNDFSGLMELLENIFRRKIDLVKPNLIREELKSSILEGEKYEAKV